MRLEPEGLRLDLLLRLLAFVNGLWVIDLFYLE